MKGPHWLLTTLGMLMGGCCLLVAATTFSSPAWFPATAREFILTWGPVLCISGVGAMVVAVVFPDAFNRTHLKLAGITAAVLGLMVGASLLI